MNPAIFLAPVSFLSSAFIIQTSRFFAVFEIQPNLFLIILSQYAVFFSFSKGGFLKFIASAGFTVFSLVLFFPFWRPELIILLIASFLVFSIICFFPVNEYVDFAVFMLAAQILFYGGLWLFLQNTFIFSANFFYETAVSLILGLLLLYCIQKFKK